MFKRKVNLFSNFILLLFLITSCQDKENDNTNYLRGNNINGKVKSIIYTTYDVGLNGLKRIERISKIECDKQGNRISIDIRDSLGKLIEKASSTYDAQGNMLTQLNFRRYEDKADMKTIMKYDAKNEMVEKKEYHGSGVVQYRYLYSQDVNGNRIEEEMHELSDGESGPSKVESHFDSKGRLVATFVEDKNVPLYKNSTISYDSSGNFIKNTLLDEKGITIMTSNSEYDERSNIKVKCTEVFVGVINKITFTFTYELFDDEGNYGIQKIFLNGEIQKIREAKYDYYLF